MALPPKTPAISTSPTVIPTQLAIDPRTAARHAAERQLAAREVDEAVRQDEMASFARRWGLPILAAIVAVLLALGGYLWWRHAQAAEVGARGEALALALDQVQAGHFDAGEKALQPLAKDPGTGIGATAELMHGAIAQEQGRGAEAARAFGAISADDSAPTALRDLATLRATTAQFDTLPPQQVIDRLKPLAVPGGPWFGNAGEVVAMAYLKQGKRDLAGPLFAAIAKDATSPDTVRRRARQLAGLLGVDTIEDAGKTVADDAGAQAQ